MPELELRVLDEFNERDKQTPRVRSVDNQPLQQHTRYLLLNRLRVRLGKQVQQRAAEIVRMTVGIAQLIGNGVQKQIPTYYAHTQYIHSTHAPSAGHFPTKPRPVGWSLIFSFSVLFFILQLRKYVKQLRYKFTIILANRYIERKVPKSLKPPTFSVHINGKVLKDVHVGRMCNGRRSRSLAFAVYILYCLRTDVQYQSIHQWYVVLHSWRAGHLPASHTQLIVSTSTHILCPLPPNRITDNYNWQSSYYMYILF